jgi:WD40 repeat protein
VGHKAIINKLDIAGGLLVSCSNDGKLFLWDLKSNNPEPKKSIAGHKSAVKDCRFSPDFTRIASVDIDGFIIISEVASEEQIKIGGDEILNRIIWLDEEEVVISNNKGAV